MTRRRQAIEDQIIRYKSMLWTATDQLTRDALFESIRTLQIELAEFEARVLTEPVPAEPA